MIGGQSIFGGKKKKGNKKDPYGIASRAKKKKLEEKIAAGMTEVEVEVEAEVEAEAKPPAPAAAAAKVVAADGEVAGDLPMDLTMAVQSGTVEELAELAHVKELPKAVVWGGMVVGGETEELKEELKEPEPEAPRVDLATATAEELMEELREGRITMKQYKAATAPPVVAPPPAAKPGDADWVPPPPPPFENGGLAGVAGPVGLAGATAAIKVSTMGPSDDQIAAVRAEADEYLLR